MVLFAPELRTRLSRRDIALSPTIWRMVALIVGLGASATLAALLWVGPDRRAAVAALATGLALLAAAMIASRPPALGSITRHLVMLAILTAPALAVVAFAPHSSVVLGAAIFSAPIASVWFERRWQVLGYSALAATAILVPSALGLVDEATTAAALWLAPSTFAVAVCNLVTLESIEAQGRELEHLVKRDPLTGLGNTSLLDEQFEIELLRHRASRQPLAILLLDLRGFKAINDAHGHGAGDRALVAVGKVLEASCAPGERAMRIGGDEFCVLLPRTTRIVAEARAATLADALRQQAKVDARVVHALSPADGEDADTLLANADERMRAAKADGSRGQAPAVLPGGGEPLPTIHLMPLQPVHEVPRPTTRVELASSPLLWRMTGATMLALSCFALSLTVLLPAAAPPPFRVVALVGLGVGVWCLLSRPALIGTHRNHAVIASCYLLTGATLATTGSQGLIVTGLSIWIGPLAAVRLISHRQLLVHLGLACVAVAAGVLAAGPTSSLVGAALLLITATAVLALCCEFVAETSERQGAELQRLAGVDPLTGIGNRRALIETLEATMDEGPVSVLALDLDGFKAVNDRVGFAAGNTLLRDVAAALQATVGARGSVFRQGGDEFAAVLPGVDAAAAARVADELRAAMPQELHGGLAITTGIGAASTLEAGGDAAALLAAADRALAASKRPGGMSEPLRSAKAG